MDDDRNDGTGFDPALKEWLKDAYNAPAEPPRKDMWTVIQAGMASRGAPTRALAEVRERKAGLHRPLGWAAAAAAVLVLGIGIGRVSAPNATPTPGSVHSAAPTVATRAASAVATSEPNTDLLRAAAIDHLGRTESMLTLVRADARDGRLDPDVGPWARGLLSRTRLLLDSPGSGDPAMRELLEDLELVLVQIVGVTEHGGDQARTRSEMTLALQGLEENDVLPRIQAVVPAGPGLAGT